MPVISLDLFNKKLATVAALQADRRPWWEHWRELADYFLPRRYIWLLSHDERRRIKSKNPFILDATGTSAARTLASGMMNGITSPSRPWFKLRIPGLDEEANRDARIWLDEVEKRLLLIMGETNFYNALAVLYLDLTVFGTGAMLIYEDFASVFRCYNSALGEYYLAQDQRLAVNTFAREITLKVHQVVDRWGVENVSARVADAYNAKGGRLQEDIDIVHLIEPNLPGEALVAKRFPFREIYWEKGSNEGKILAASGFNELPGIFPRWELLANDAYGSSPAMDSLPDVIQLQHETKRKAQSIDYMNRPPVIAGIELQHKPTALMPGGQTFVSNVERVGAKPVYTVQPPLRDMAFDISEVRQRIRETFHNDLFKMISQLDTVRSATEIDARREEKLVLLGPVLERFENEALDPAIRRIFAIADRAGLIPDPPEQIQDEEIEIQYVSILSVAQRAVGVIPIERWVQLIGQVGAVAPSTLNVPDWDELVRDYGRDIGVKAKLIRARDETEEASAQQEQAEQLRQSIETGEVAAKGAKTLADAGAGGGAQAIRQLLGA